MWWNVTVWGDTFDAMLTRIKKGSLIMVYGEMREPRIYQTRDGQSRVSLDLTARYLRFPPSSRTPERPGEAGAYPQEEVQRYAKPAAPSSSPANSYGEFGNVEFITPSSRPSHMSANTPASTPGGFMPGRGSANLSEMDSENDNLPF